STNHGLLIYISRNEKSTNHGIYNKYFDFQLVYTIFVVLINIHYRDSNGLECDSVIHLRNGRYGLVEIKLGGQALIEEGAKTLNKFESLIDTKKMNGPSFKMILTAVGSLAYKREDGIYVVPIDCLKN
ncbi:MAG: hypothetical protein UH071_05645, partial [Paludibacteraceae bacterium]|nr:hypothetical protein [Paludibacteraceae bacterium]